MALTVLAIDDDPFILGLLETRLSSAGYKVFTATTAADGLRIFEQESPKIVITDLMMPQMSGIEVCRTVRDSQPAGFVYILVISSASETRHILDAFEAGANDFLAKPFDHSELLARLHAGTRVIQLEEELAQDRLTIHKANAELMVLNKKLQAMATTDELTGLPNRREAFQLLDDMWAMAQRQNQPLSCMMIDIDYFKNYNDQYGHEAGDAVLRSTANILKSVVRANEAVCRIGGEEFVILCPLSTAEIAGAGADRIRRVIESNKVNHGSTAVAVTISIGVAEKLDSTESSEKLLRDADTALYAAKHSGRNRVCFVPTDASEPNDTDRALQHSDLQHDDTAGKIVVVDDDETIRRMCRHILEKHGYEVIEAADGQEGLLLTSREMPDLVLMDIEMPKIDGLTCVRRIKQDQTTRHIPIVMISSRSEGDDFEAAHEVEADEYITKPFRPKEFLYRVQAVLRLHRSKAKLQHSNAVRGAQARGLSILLDLSRHLADCITLNQALDMVIAAAAELTLSQRISIMLPDETGQYLTVARSIGMDEKIAQEVRVPIGGDTAGQVFLSKEPVLVNSSDQTTNKIDNDYASKFFVSAPLVSTTLRTKNRVVGVLNITNRYDSGSFDPVDVELIDLICNIAASAIDVIESHQARDNAQNAIMVALAQLAEHRDDDTGKHLERVTRYSLMIAEELRTYPQYKDQINDVFLTNLERAVPLHDIGKVAIPDAILLKPGKLTADEMEFMKSHVVVGANTIRSALKHSPNVPFLSMALDIIQGHHEWYNGAGYPNGTSGEEIPLCARIAAFADVYDALTSARPYKKALPHQEALSIIRSSVGTHFDPVLAEAFFKLEHAIQELSQELCDTPAAASANPTTAKHGSTPLAEAG